MKANFEQLVDALERLICTAEFIDGTSQLEFASIGTAISALRAYKIWGNDVNTDAKIKIKSGRTLAKEEHERENHNIETIKIAWC